jgi:hypothetical protein
MSEKADPVQLFFDAMHDTQVRISTTFQMIEGKVRVMEELTEIATKAASYSAEKNQETSHQIKMTATILVTIAVFVTICGFTSAFWQWNEMNNLTSQAQDIRDQIQRDKGNLAALDAKGGRVKWYMCGGRLCFQAASDQGATGKPNTEALSAWKSWVAPNTNAPLVVPDGY